MLTKRTVFKIFFSMVVFFVVTFLLVLTTSRAAFSSPSEDIPIGAVLDLSGPASTLGIEQKRGMEMAIAEINGRGGVKIGGKTFSLKAMVEDDGYTADRAVAASYKLVGQGIKFMLCLGITALPVQTATEPAKVLLFPTASIDKLLINKPYTFRIYLSQSVNSIMLLEYLKANLPAGQRVYLVQPDDVGGREAKDLWGKYAPSYGFRWVGEDLFPPKTMDFAPLVTRVLLQKPDIVVTRGIKSCASFAKGILAQGYEGKFVMSIEYPRSFIEDVGSEKLGDGRLIGPTPDLNKEAPEKIRKLSSQYYNTYKETIALYGTYTYNYVDLIAQAISKAGTATDTDKVKAVLESTEFDLPWGKIRFGGEAIYGRPGDGFFPVFISVYNHSEKGNKTVVKYTAGEARDKYLRAVKVK